MADVADQFSLVTRQFGAEPLHYLSGEINHLNRLSADWNENSRETVASVDLCVFVILRRHGDITWNTELKEALNAGKPFIILCLSSTYDMFLNLTRNVPDLTAIKDNGTRKLIRTMSELGSERHLTLVQFDMANFSDVYRREASRIFTAGLSSLQVRFQREALAGILSAPADLSTADLAAAEEVALDEFEDKYFRKRAIFALIDRAAASAETAAALVASREQGVQRLAIHHLADLYRQRPPAPEFLADCVSLANHSDDVGVIRRLVPALFQLDVTAAIEALAELDLSEIGTRRKLAGELEAYEDQLVDPAIRELAVSLLERCMQDTKDVGWLARCRAYLDRLKTTS
ncbi:hypothetical protein AB0P21_30700 [Kribbella sp. NPDC056861]|uniref:hypothetical protein n=1 Tax=Kribbella sp. NPDC056861 TaxID=3154857 RepID=UPI003414B922